MGGWVQGKGPLRGRSGLLEVQGGAGAAGQCRDGLAQRPDVPAPPPPPPAQARQVFERLPGEGVGGPGGDADARFAHFKAALWPRIRESGRSGGHLIYIPSYFDYVR